LPAVEDVACAKALGLRTVTDHRLPALMDGHIGLPDAGRQPQ
jgi:hypothetical protein